MKVDLAVFAYNEAGGIAAFLKALTEQTIFADPQVEFRALVLANGCKDDTAAQARRVPGLEVLDLPEPGKSRTWHRFVHEFARQDADVLIFCDADIDWPSPDLLSGLVATLDAHPKRVAMSSRPVKDLTLDSRGAGLAARLIKAATGESDAWQDAICGQLYVARADAVRAIPMPVGLPVEDGYVRAMLLTECFTNMDSPNEIEGDPALYHVYESERSLTGLLRHQVRIVIGSSINTTIFTYLSEQPVDQRHAVLARAAADPNWLAQLLRDRLPVWPSGYVSMHYLLKRSQSALSPERGGFKLRKLPMLVLGFGFDAVVYLWAQWRMARGVGSGFW